MRLFFAFVSLCLCGFLLPSCKEKPVVPSIPPIKNVLLITIDTLRADALSVYGNKTRTPFFEELARDSVVFENALTCAPVTLPAHTSLLTGLYPPSHGVRNNGTFYAPDSLRLLSEYAKQNGSTTAAIVGGFPLASQFGLNQGFDLYDDHFEALGTSPGVFAYTERDAAAVTARAEKWLSERADGGPFFLWLHFFDPHHPYMEHGLPAPSPYQQEVLYVDGRLAELFQFLKEKKLRDNLLVLVTADHGEAFGEHREVSHSLFLYNTTLHIPLMISVPGIAPGRKAGITRIVDIAPTIMDAMNWQSSARMDGRSLMPILRGKEELAVENFAETLAPSLDYGWSPLFSIQDLHGKYIQAPRPEYYDLAKDPGETQNLIATVRTDPYSKKIAQILASSQRVSQHTLSSEEKERLQSLGYFSSPPGKPVRNAPDPKDRVDTAAKIAELTMSPAPIVEKEKAYRAIAEQEPANPVLLLRYAEILLALHKYDKAETVFQQVLNLEYPSPAVYNGLAAVYFEINQPDRAERILREAVKLDLADGETFYNLAEFLFQHGSQDEAFAFYEKSMKKGFVPAFYRTARLSEVRGDLNKSFDLLEDAERLAPGRVETLHERAMIYTRHNQLPSALEQFQKALKQRPDDPVFLYNIGILYRRMNRLEDARRSLQKFLEVAPPEMKDERQAAINILKE